MLFLFLDPFNDCEYYDKYYDGSAKLLYVNRKTRGFDLNFNFKEDYMHPIPDSIEYAALLLQSGNVKKASEILEKVLSFQNKSTSSSKFGSFPEFAELKDNDDAVAIKSAHITLPLLQLYSNYRSLLDDKLVDSIKMACSNILIQIFDGITAVSHAASYGMLKEIYSLFRFGNLFNFPEYLSIGIKYLNSFYAGVIYNESFWEFGSLYECYVTSELLCMIKNDIQDASCRGMIDSLYDLLWKTIATNFHPGLLKYTGPKTDMSKKMPQDQFLVFLSQATGISFNKIVNSSKNKIVSRCPQHYLFLFSNTHISRFNQLVISRGSTFINYYKQRIATNYMQPSYTIGSLNHESFWYGHIPLLGYFKSRQSGSIYKVELSVLCNNKPFASAELHSVQYKGTILGHITFVSNRGYFHYDFMNTKGKIKAKDIRIRLSITGDIKKLKIKTYSRSMSVCCDNFKLSYKVPYVNIDDIPIEFSSTQTGNSYNFDTVLLKSKKSETLDLKSMETAVCQFVLQASTTPETVKCLNKISNENIITTTKSKNHDLKLLTPKAPTLSELGNIYDKQYIDNIPLEQFVTKKQVNAEQYQFIATFNNDLQHIRHFSNLSTIIFDAFENVTFETLNQRVNKLYTLLNEADITLDTYKRYSLYILRNIFDFAKSQNSIFENIINTDFFDIYIKISLMTSKKKVCLEIMNAAEIIHNNYDMLSTKNRRQSLINSALEFINENYWDSNLSLYMVAKHLGVSESYMTRIFKQVTNSTYVHQVIQVRIEKAKNMLVTNMPIYEVAEKCGYLNVSSFRRSFKKFTGVSVNQWKNTHQ